MKNFFGFDMEMEDQKKQSLDMLCVHDFMSPHSKKLILSCEDVGYTAKLDESGNIRLARWDWESVQLRGVTALKLVGFDVEELNVLVLSEFFKGNQNCKYIYVDNGYEGQQIICKKGVQKIQQATNSDKTFQNF